MRSDNIDPFERQQNRRSFRQNQSQNRSQQRRRPKSQSAPTSRDGGGAESERRVTYNENRQNRGREQFQRQVSAGGNQKKSGSKLEQYRNRSGVGGVNGAKDNSSDGTKSPPILDNRNYDQKRTPKQNRRSGQNGHNNHGGGGNNNNRRAKSRSRKNHDYHDNEREVVVRGGDQRVGKHSFFH